MIRTYKNIEINLEDVYYVFRAFQNSLIFCFTDNDYDAIMYPHKFNCEIEFDSAKECLEEYHKVVNLLEKCVKFNNNRKIDISTIL